LKVWEKLSKASKKKFPRPKESLIKVPKPEKIKKKKTQRLKEEENYILVSVCLVWGSLPLQNA
jgi:hypothetical protein